MVEAKITGSIREYLRMLSVMGIHAQRAVLYGSFVRGQNHSDSDIDLIVIAPEFDGNKSLENVKKLWRATTVDYRIEPIPCGEKEWETDQKRPILEIARQEGVVISVN